MQIIGAHGFAYIINAVTAVLQPQGSVTTPCSRQVCQGQVQVRARVKCVLH